jgi:excisionase family DNA binding protein
MGHRFLTVADVTEILNISPQQAYALLRSGELPAIQIGVNGQWRIEADQLEAYIERLYHQTRSRISGREQSSDAAHEV